MHYAHYTQYATHKINKLTLSNSLNIHCPQVVFSLASLAAGQLVVYPNGAVAPFDPNNAAATKVLFPFITQ